MSDSKGGKLKFLCLHGYLQNAEIFRSRIGSMRKALKSRIEFVFIDAPFEAQGLPAGEAEEVDGARDGRSWWQWTDVGPAGRPSKAAHYTGWEITEAALLAALKEHQPDGILGFSQGATATALLLGALESAAHQQPDLPKLKCAIVIAGFLPRDAHMAAALRSAQPSSVPCLFVGGDSDVLVPPERTQELISCFAPGCVSGYQHSGAHLVPTCSGEFKSCLVAFLDAVKAGDVKPMKRVQSQAAMSADLPAES